MPTDVAIVDQNDIYRLGKGDRLRVTVFGHEDLSGEFEIGSAGEIAFPPIGNLQVEGRSLEDVEGMIVSGLRPDHLKNPVVSVKIIENRDVYILEEVPGPYDPSGGMFHAVLRWCGPAQRPNESHSPIWLLCQEGRCRTGYTYRSGEDLG